MHTHDEWETINRRAQKINIISTRVLAVHTRRHHSSWRGHTLILLQLEPQQPTSKPRQCAKKKIHILVFVLFCINFSSTYIHSSPCSHDERRVAARKSRPKGRPKRWAGRTSHTEEHFEICYLPRTTR